MKQSPLAPIMADFFKLTRIRSLKTVADFRNHVAALGLELPCEDAIASGADSPLEIGRAHV